MNFIVLFFASFIAAVPFASSAEKSPPKPDASASPGEKSECLQCHDVFEKLAAGPQKFTAESGEKINPHMYVPHEAKIPKNIPQCTRCHRPHAIPLTSKETIPQPTIDWCYSCHHAFEFKPCGACHK